MRSTLSVAILAVALSQATAVTANDNENRATLAERSFAHSVGWGVAPKLNGLPGSPHLYARQAWLKPGYKGLIPAHARPAKFAMARRYAADGAVFERREIDEQELARRSLLKTAFSVGKKLIGTFLKREELMLEDRELSERFGHLAARGLDGEQEELARRKFVRFPYVNKTPVRTGMYARHLTNEYELEEEEREEHQREHEELEREREERVREQEHSLHSLHRPFGRIGRPVGHPWARPHGHLNDLD